LLEIWNEPFWGVIFVDSCLVHRSGERL
jgi:hypothetical protein